MSYHSEDQDYLEVLRQAKAGSKGAREYVVNRNIGLIKSIAKRFLGRGHEYEDLFQVGSIGLMKAINNFDESFNVKFSTYAVPMILGEIKRFIRDDGMIKVSRNLKDLAVKIKAASEKLKKEYNRDPTITEISKETQLNIGDILNALEASLVPLSLHEPVYHEEGKDVTVMDKLTDQDNMEGEMIDKLILKELLLKLEKRERQIIILRYFKDKTQREIADLLGISQVQVSRVEKKVIEKMKSMLE